MRNIIWFNRTYSRLVKSNTGKYFLSLLDKPLPLNHKFKKFVAKIT